MKQFHLKGGRLFGKGAFGSVYGEPRIPCADENADEIKNNSEVSKRFISNHEAEKEFGLMDKLNALFPPDDLEQFKQLAMLPIKICDMNDEAMRLPPYSTNEWKGEPTRHQSSKIVIYKKGVSDAGIYLQDLTEEVSIDNFADMIYGFKDILTSIQLLQKNNLCHGDIKEMNIIHYVQPDTEESLLKLSDNSDIRSIIPLQKDLDFFTTNYLYFARPSIMCYAELWNRSRRRHYLHQINLDRQFTTTELQTLLHRTERFNTRSFYYTAYNLRHGTNFNTKRGFNRMKSDIYATMAIDLFNQQTFNVLKIHPFSTPIEYDLRQDLDFHNLIKDPARRVHIENSLFITNQYFQRIKDTEKQIHGRVKQAYYNKYYNNDGIEDAGIDGMDDMNKQIKLDLFKRMDIYSFGMMMFALLVNYRIGISTAGIHEIDEKSARIVDQLIHLAYLCCKQTSVCVDINIIMTAFDAIIRTKGEQDIAIDRLIPRFKPIHQNLICDTIHRYHEGSEHQIFILQHGVENGHLRSMYLLGKLYKYQRNYEQMKRYYQMAVGRGDIVTSYIEKKYAALAAYELGLYYELIEINYNEMRNNYTIAGDYGIDRAMYRLGMYYIHIEPNHELASQYLIFAIRHGHKEALKQLVIYFERINPQPAEHAIYNKSMTILDIPTRPLGINNINDLIQKDQNIEYDYRRIMQIAQEEPEANKKEFLKHSYYPHIEYTIWKYTDILYDYRQEQSTKRIIPNYLEAIQDGIEITPEFREQMVQFILNYANVLKNDFPELYEDMKTINLLHGGLAVDIMDRYLSIKRITKNKLKLLTVVFVYIATKYVYTIKVDDTNYLDNIKYVYERFEDVHAEYDGLTPLEILHRAENEVNEVLEYDIVKPTTSDFMNRLIDVCQFDDKEVIITMQYLVERSYQHYPLLRFKPSVISSSIIGFVLAKLAYKPWTQFLMFYTGHIPTDLENCISHIQEMIRNDLNPEFKYKYIYKYYKSIGLNIDKLRDE
jgi:hypothetical protein